jgi:membrane protease YdiL (CAAX protease family)
VAIPLRRTVIALIMLLVLLSACTYTFVHTVGWERLWLQTIGYGSLAAVFIVSGLRAEDIGLSPARLRGGIRFTLTAVAIVAAALVVFYAIDGQFFKDPRFHHPFSVALFAVLVLLPLKTVLFEELAFRGLLLALFTKLSARRWPPVLLSSVCFGLWHVSSAALIGTYTIGSGIVIPQFFVVFAAVVATSAAGIALCWLRLRSGSLLAPIGVHWALNGVGLLLAAFSWR